MEVETHVLINVSLGVTMTNYADKVLHFPMKSLWIIISKLDYAINWSVSSGSVLQTGSNITTRNGDEN